MFGKNEIIGTREFAHEDRRILIASMFHTLQGEGPYQGQPSVFVRTAKCNLACSFCDTQFDKGQWFDPDDLFAATVRIAKKVHNDYLRMKAECGVVITGGEPSLQKNITRFIRKASRDFAFTQIESNGILLLDDLPRSTTLVVSPKCFEKDGKATRYLTPTNEMLQRADCLKFVMSADETSPYHEVPLWARDWRKATGKPIYVSPMNIYAKLPKAALPADTLEQRNEEEVISFWDPGLLDMEKNADNHRHAARYAVANGLWLTLQQHLYAGLA